MAATGVPRIDDLFGGSAGVAAIVPGDTDHLAVGCVQDLLAGYGFAMPTMAASSYGLFGPQTTDAVGKFRARVGLATAGGVDAATLRQLVTQAPASPRATRAYTTMALDFPFSGLVKILCCVAQVEGAGRFAATNANTDKQGLSYGVIQWAQKQLRLPELLNAFSKQARAAFVETFGAGSAAVADGLLAHVAKPQGGVAAGDGQTTDPAFNLVESPWIERFQKAGTLPDFQKIQITVAVASLQKSLDYLRKYASDMTSERCVAFMLDLANQRGDGGAKRTYSDAKQPGMTPHAVLQAIADADKTYKARRQFYIDSPWLSDDAFSP